MNKISIGSVACSIKVFAARRWQLPNAFASSRVRFLAICAKAAAEVSTKSQCAAPRDSASRPSAPLPANKSAQCAPFVTGANQLNSVSRILSDVGRKPSAGVNFNGRLRHWPPIIRSVLAALVVFLDPAISSLYTRVIR